MSLSQNSEISLHSISLEVFETSVILFFCKQSVFCLKIWDFFSVLETQKQSQKRPKTRTRNT